MAYREEHPKPQFMREHWQNLNGRWQFEIDRGESGLYRALYEEGKTLDSVIEVPFCPESPLSGIGCTDFMRSVFYKRSFTLTEEELCGRVILHFGAVDYKTTVYINGRECGRHTGGYVSFSFDITAHARVGENTVTVHAEDDTKDRMIPSGKQSDRYESFSCFYTRTTGIWQTVWLEFVPRAYIRTAKYYPDIDTASLSIHAELCGGGRLTAVALYEGREVGRAQADSAGGMTVLHLPLSERHLWEAGNGRLYDLVLTFGDDRVTSYFGLRKIRIDGYRILINERPVFQRLILDQGFYPDGIYTAPSDAELIADIDRSLAMGFNGARLHEKIFEERFLYHCDRKGYLVWGEFPNWGIDASRADAVHAVLPEWMEEVERDFNHPAIVGWCPFNEVWYNPSRAVIQMVYDVTKQLDPTRPAIDTSGGLHVERTDVTDTHSYAQDPVAFAKLFEKLAEEDLFYDGIEKKDLSTHGRPFFVSEYGGIAWTGDGKGWGYGMAPKSEEASLTRLKGLTDVLMDNPKMIGLCYTQLTDVEQEKNGLYTYDRKPKFAPEKIYPIFARAAAIEEE